MRHSTTTSSVVSACLPHVLSAEPNLSLESPPRKGGGGSGPSSPPRVGPTHSRRATRVKPRSRSRRLTADTVVCPSRRRRCASPHPHVVSLVLSAVFSPSRHLRGVRAGVEVSLPWSASPTSRRLHRRVCRRLPASAASCRPSRAVCPQSTTSRPSFRAQGRVETATYLVRPLSSSTAEFVGSRRGRVIFQSFLAERRPPSTSSAPQQPLPLRQPAVDTGTPSSQA